MKKILTSLFILFTFLAACSPAPSPFAEPDIVQNGIEIYQARVPVPVGLSTAESMDMPMDFNLAAFMTIKNTSNTDDRLLSVSVDFANASIHETKMNGDVMQMVEVDGIDIPTGQTVELRSGGFHIMLMNPTEQPQIGSTVNLTLEFEKAGRLIVPAKVVEQ
jgi:copper(I)-binding protein